MDTWIWITVAGVAVLVVLAGAWALIARRTRQRRTERLRERFGREYDRVVADHGRRGPAEAELEARLERRKALELRELTADERARYRALWEQMEAQVDSASATALGLVNGLVIDIMRDRGYPSEGFELRAADLSVDHPELVEDYYVARESLLASDSGTSTPEELERGLDGGRRVILELLAEPAPAEADEALAVTS
jgi:hypothetical protein